MKQVWQSARSGEITVSEVPAPGVAPGRVLVRVAYSVVSPGTERHMTEFGKKSLIQKARARPDLVRQVLDKARRDGVATTVSAVQGRLERPVTLGYSNAGTVLAVGEGISDLQPGDRVACSGGGHATHSEVVSVPRLLVTKLPDDADLETAAFTTLGAVALHGARLARVQLGEVVAVLGLGVLGQLAVVSARAAGCRVVAMDPHSWRAGRAAPFGAEAVATDARQLAVLIDRLTGGRGADAVLIAADASTSEPVEVAAEIACDRGRVVSIGSVLTNLPRKPYFDKELEFRISRSYGPGRYDPEYEEKGHDYPFGYVRWTENRNMACFAALIAEGRVPVASLVTHRVPIEEATRAYDIISGKTSEPFLGVVLTCSNSDTVGKRTLVFTEPTTRSAEGRVSVAFLGAGQFAAGILIPAMAAAPGVELTAVCAGSGLSSERAARKFRFRYATTDEDRVLSDPDVAAVVIATRHADHGRQVVAALKAGKHVFCEKPLCLTLDELGAIAGALAESQSTARERPPRVLTVGYNRRFAPFARDLRDWLSGIEGPRLITYRVNAGPLDRSHWMLDPAQGGRIAGEACHFIDFAAFLTGRPASRVSATACPDDGHGETASIRLDYPDGSIATVLYASNGARGFSKERVEVFAGGGVAMIDDFRLLDLVRGGRRTVRRSRLRQDKGHRAECEAFVRSLREGTAPPIDHAAIFASTLTTIATVESIRTGASVAIDHPTLSLE